MADDGIAHQSPRWTGPPLAQPDGLAAAVDPAASLVGPALAGGASVVAGASDVVPTRGQRRSRRATPTQAAAHSALASVPRMNRSAAAGARSSA